MWNAWKAKLLEDLFHATRARLAGAPAPPRSPTACSERQDEARRLLRLYAVPEGAEQTLWSQLDAVYFQRHTAEEIAWHARHLYWRVDGTTPVVQARLSRADAGLQVLVYLPDQKDLFARICGFFGRAGLSILEAKIHTTRHGYALDTFAVHDPASPNASYRDTIQLVEFELKRVLEEQRPLEPPVSGRVSRQLKHFPLTPEVRIFPDDKGTHYILEIVAGDRPGLLAQIAYTLAKAQHQRRQRQDQHAGRARRGRLPDRRRAAARRAGAAAARDGALRAVASALDRTSRRGSRRASLLVSGDRAVREQDVGEAELRRSRACASDRGCPAGGRIRAGRRGRGSPTPRAGSAARCGSKPS